MAFKVCLIGCGAQAHNSYVTPLRKYTEQFPDTELACCCDVNAQAAEAFAKEAGFAGFSTDYEKMLESEHPDAVLLVTPYTVTASIAQKVLSMGIPALIEKPLGNNAQEAKLILQAAEQSSTPNQVAFNRRHIPLIRALMERIGERPVRHIDYRMHRVQRKEDHFNTTAVHGLDLAGFLAGGKATRVDFAYQSTEHFGQGVMNIQALAQYAGGTTASMSFCPTAGLVCEQLCVALDNETIFVDLPIWGARGNAGFIEVYEKDSLLYSKTGLEISDGDTMPDSNGFTCQLFRFLNDIRAGVRPRDDVASGLEAMNLSDCIAARQTFYCGEKV